MRIALLTVGTRGDAQPIVALSAELARRGHLTSLGVPPNLVAFAKRARLDVVPLGNDSQAFMESTEGRELLASGNVNEFMERLRAVAHDQAAQRNAEMRDLCEGADVIVSGALTEHQALSLAERSDIPLVLIHICPIRTTGAVANPLVTTSELPASQNRETHELFDRIWWKGAEADVNAQRAELGLAPTDRPTTARVKERGDVEIQAYSSSLVPDLGWGDSRPVVGFIDLCAEDYRNLGETDVDAGLDAWLNDGPPPAYFGFAEHAGDQAERHAGDDRQGHRRARDACPGERRLERDGRWRERRPGSGRAGREPRRRPSPLHPGGPPRRIRHDGCVAAGRAADDGVLRLRRSALLGHRSSASAWAATYGSRRSPSKP